MSDYPAPQHLTETDWLVAHLEDPEVRILDASLKLVPDDQGRVSIVSCAEDWERSHIPGSRYVHLQDDLAAPHDTLRFVFPTAHHFAEVMSRFGVGSDTHLVVYSGTGLIWATRLWYMARAFGMQRVSVLNGGFGRWQAEGRPVTTEVVTHRPVRFEAREPAGRVVAKAELLDLLEDGGTCVLNALSREQHRGEGPHYGRPGRIRGSVNVPWAELTDPETGLVRAAADLEALFTNEGSLGAERIVTYCGGGIAATGAAFALALLGLEDRVALYDGSLSEWAADPTAPMETG